MGVKEVEQMTSDASGKHADLIFIQDWHIKQANTMFHSGFQKVFVCREGRGETEMLEAKLDLISHP